MIPRDNRWRLPLAGGAMLCLAFYSRALVPNFVCFFPLLLWLDLDERSTRLRRAWAGFFFGVGLYVPAFHFTYAMLSYSWLAALLYAGMVLAFSLKVALVVALLGWLRARTRRSFGLLLPVTWLSVEWAQTFGDLRMTGDHVAQSLAGHPFLVQFADLVGPYGVGAFLLAANGLIYEALQATYARDRRRSAALLVLGAAAVLGYDAYAWSKHAAMVREAPRLRVAIVQPNVPIEVKRGAEGYIDQWRLLERLTRDAAAEGAELIVWPETARPWPLYHRLSDPATFALPDVESLARRLGVSILVGVEYARGEDDDRPWKFYNAALLVHADGTLDPSWGAKVYLVPFTEGVPLRGLLGPLVEGRGGEWRWVAGGFEPGPQSPLLPVRRDPAASPSADPIPVGVLVCYEQFFPDLARTLRNRDAAIQAVITNDAWFGRSPFQKYQADMTRLRAIENRTSIVRAANTGYSQFVDPLGRVSGRTELFVEALPIEDVSLASQRTLYDRTGDISAWLALAGLVWSAAAARRRKPGVGSAIP